MNTHGWTTLAGPGSMQVDGATVQIHMMAIAPIVEQRKRCACQAACCHRAATAEDLRCDECREECHA